jgi:hypothetical protein
VRDDRAGFFVDAIALACHYPRKRVIQYSRDAGDQPRSRGVLDTRRSLSSGGHSADPLAGMTASPSGMTASYVSRNMR